MVVSGTMRRLALAAAVVAVSACGGGDDPSAPEGFGDVTGRIVAADGTTPIPGAEVGLAARPAGGPIDTTDANGNYSLADVPAGRQTLLARRGVFQAQFQVTVRADESVAAPLAEVTPVGELAYVPGAFDAIEEIVRDSLEFPIEALDAADLGTRSVIDQYSMIFLNCGADVSIVDDATALANLKDWVNDGGVLYASDWSIDVVKALFPTDVQSTIDDGEEQDVTGTVTSDALEAFIGKGSVSLRYDLPSWRTVDALSATPQVLVRGSFTGSGGTYSNKPLAVRIGHGDGQVVFTSFHNEAGVTADQLAVLRYFIFLD